MTEELFPSEKIEKKAKTSKIQVKVIKIIDEENGFKITVDSKADLHISQTLPTSVKGTLIIDDIHIPIIDFQAKNGHLPQEITDKSCVLIKQSEIENHTITRGAFHQDISSVLDIIKEKF